MEDIAPRVKIGGSAFMGNSTQAHRPLSRLSTQNYLAVVTLRQWCEGNFITRRIGYKLIKLKYLIAFRRHGQWWVTANPDCIEQLLEVLGQEKLLFDVPQEN